MRILVIEDEKKVSQFVRKALEEERHAVDQAFDGEEGLDLAEVYEYDLIILDLMLPKTGGFQVLESVRKKGLRAPVLILTAKDGVREKVRLLDAGGDDYLTKPFSIEELLARVRVLLRRGRSNGSSLLEVGDLRFDLSRREVVRGKRKIDLTNKECALLEYLMRNSGRVVTRSMIAEHVWNIDFDTESNIIDVYITYLRNKVDKGETIRLIKTVRGAGYTMKE